MMDDFGSIGMVDIRGRRNYDCDLKPGLTCQEGYAARCPHKGTHRCPSSQAEMLAATSALVVTSYAKWTSARKFGQGMSHFQQVIFDEGHMGPEALASAMQVVLHQKEIEQTLKLSFPLLSECEAVENWKAWALTARARVQLEMAAAHRKIQGHDPKSAWVHHYTHMRNLARRLSILSTCRPAEWVVDAVPKGYQFDPIRPGQYAEAALLLRVPRIVVMSATLRPKTLHMMGIPSKDFKFTEFASDFDPNRSPVYWVPTMRVDKNALDLSPLWIRIEQCAYPRRDRKGIIHSVSYDRQARVVEHIDRFRDMMIVNPRGEAPSGTIDEFTAAPDGTILVSPSVGAGYNFPGAACEWQVLCKVPFLDGRSKITQAKQADDKEYGPYQAIQKMVQTFGRGMRYAEDQCENFIFDDHAGQWFLRRWGYLAPKSFLARYRPVASLPPPPPRLMPRRAM